MRKTPIVISSLLLSVIGVYLVGSSYAKPLAPTMRVGVMVSDSGPLYFAGPIQRAAVKLAVTDLAKAEQPVTVNIDFEDLGDSDSEFTDVTNRLSKFKPDLTVAPIESTSALKFLKYMGPVPVISVSALTEKADNPNWSFRLATTQSQAVIALAQYVVDSRSDSVGIVFSDDDYGRTTMKSLAMAFALRGFGKVQIIPISENSLLSKATPDAVVLASLEQSIGFLSNYSNWSKRIKQLYLVEGNQANYSNYPWAENLTGALALSSDDDVPVNFRSRLALALNRPGLQTSQNPMVAIAFRTYQAIMLAADSYLRAKSSSGPKLRSALLDTQVDGVNLFTSAGFLNQAKYTIYKYSAKGLYSSVGKFDPKQ
jgi:branched-chain amino acid transport system substrate-binding protein